MIGPQEQAKSVLAARLPGILPPLEPGEALHLAMIQSIAAAHLPRLDPAAITNTLGIAGSLAGGLREFARGDGGMVKRLYLGRASEAGVLAASLAAAGFEGPRTVLEGEFGFLEVFCTKWDETLLTRRLGEEFVVSSTVLKRYPCHATAHAAVRAVRDLQAAHGFSGAEVAAVTVTGTERNNILEPLAQYSIPSFGSVVAKSAADQQPDDVLSERLHWQIPDAEILCRGAIPVPPVRRSPDALVRFTLMTDLVWLWVVYRVDSDAVFGAIRRAERLYRTAEEARSAVEQVADRMGAGEIRWDQTDEATWVARTTRYVCVVWSIRLPK